jgi:hypothetical protein
MLLHELEDREGKPSTQARLNQHDLNMYFKRQQ